MIFLKKNEHLPRERLLSQGAEALSNHELIAILLEPNTSIQNAMFLANHLLKKFGSLSQLFDAKPNLLTRIQEMDTAKIAMIMTAIELTKRVLTEKIYAKPIMHSPAAVENLLKNDDWLTPPRSTSLFIFRLQQSRDRSRRKRPRFSHTY